MRNILIITLMLLSMPIWAISKENFEFKNVQVGANAVIQFKGESYSEIVRYDPY